MPLSLTMHRVSSDANPFAAVNARAQAAAGTRDAARPEAQGTFSAHLTVTLYGADGRARTLHDGPSSLLGATLGEGDASVIDVQDARGRDVTVVLRKDGTFSATENTGGGAVRYDSRDGLPAGGLLRELAQRAARIAGLASSAGTGVALAEAARDAVQDAAGPGESPKDVTVTITDGKGVSRYVGGNDGVVAASRTTSTIALQTVTIDRGVQTDAVRNRDGSGTTTVDGGALGGTRFVLTHDAGGTEEVDVTSGGGSDLASGFAATAALDAFGDRITIGSDAQRRASIQLTDGAGTTFSLVADLSGTSASLGVALAVGTSTGTQRADLSEDATATTTTGSRAHATSALEASARDAEHDGTLSFGIDASVASASHPLPDGVVETNATAVLGVRAQAAGTLDVAGAAGGRVEDGYLDDHGKAGVAGGVSRGARGAVGLHEASARDVLSIDVMAMGDDKRTPGKPENSSTTDHATIAVDAFGHRASALRRDDINRVRNHAQFASSEFVV
jgi:hypothetical protein